MDDLSNSNKELEMKLTKIEADFGSKLKDKDDVINALKTSIELYQKSNLEYEDKLSASKSMLQDMQKQLTDLQSEQNSSAINLQNHSKLLKEHKATIAQHVNTIKQLRENILENQNKQSKQIAAYETVLQEQSKTMANLQSRLELSENALKQSNINLNYYATQIEEKDAQLVKMNEQNHTIVRMTRVIDDLQYSLEDEKRLINNKTIKIKNLEEKCIENLESEIALSKEIRKLKSTNSQNQDVCKRWRQNLLTTLTLLFVLILINLLLLNTVYITLPTEHKFILSTQAGTLFGLVILIKTIYDVRITSDGLIYLCN